MLPLYTSYLTPKDYGILALLAIIGMLFSPLADLGMSNAIFRRFNFVKDADKRLQVLNTGLISVVVVSVALATIGIVFAAPLAYVLYGEQLHVELVKLTLIGACLDSISQIPQVILRADRRVKLTAGLNVVSLLVNIIMTIVLVVGLKTGVRGVVWANLSSSLFSMGFQFLFVLKTIRLAFDRLTWRWMLSYGIPFLPHRLLSLGLTQFGVYMISHMLGTEQAGLYSIATRVIIPLQMVINSVQRAWVPFKFQIHADEEHPEIYFRSITTYYVALTSYLWLGIALWGPEVIRLMATSEFHSASALVPFVALVPFSTGLYYMFGTGIELSDNTKPLPIVSLAGFVMVVIGAFTLIPLFDVYGAAIATVGGWLTMTGVIYILSQRRIKIPYDWAILALLLFMSLSIAMIGLWLQDSSIAIRVGFATLGSVIYPIAGFFILSYSKAEHVRVQMLQVNFATALKKAVAGNLHRK